MNTHRVSGPRFAPVEAGYGVVEFARLPEAVRARLNLAGEGRLFILEMAQASGLGLLAPAERNPWHTSSRGVGELLAIAARSGASAILIGIGGSATNDIGAGALEALGIEFQDTSGESLGRITPAVFAQAARLGGVLSPRMPRLFMACDVRNPLLGPNGATAIFAPQKGLPQGDFARLERSVGVMAKKLCDYFEAPRTLMMEPGSGAAGGLGFGLRVACGAELVPGFELVSDWLGLEEQVRAANAVLTGEGYFDAASLSGKGPGAVAEMAIKHGKKLIVIAGRVDEHAAAAFQSRAPAGKVTFISLSKENEPPEKALPATAARLARAVRDTV